VIKSRDASASSVSIALVVSHLCFALRFKAHRLCVSLNSRLESNKEKREVFRVEIHSEASGTDLVGVHNKSSSTVP